MSEVEKYMQRCIELAANGLGHVAPNPMVGAVVVHSGKIIGEGFHQQFGKEHAEVNAINHVIEKSLQAFLPGSTLYVNLEPCSHVGKTPPCTDLIIENKISKVVIGNVDPFEKVSGSGIKKLRDSKIEVVQGVLENECRTLNKRYFTFHEKRRPYILIKYAQSLDGFIAAETRTNENRWITNEFSLQRVHQWRSEEQAIMIGTNTAQSDNPSLTTRDWKGNNPLRIVLDRDLKLSGSLNLFDTNAPTLIFNSHKNEKKDHHEFLQIDFKENILSQVLNVLYNRNIQSVIVEGGATLLRSFIDAKIWDEARIFIGIKFIGNGLKAPAIQGKIISEENIVQDRLIIMTP